MLSASRFSGISCLNSPDKGAENPYAPLIQEELDFSAFLR